MTGPPGIPTVPAASGDAGDGLTVRTLSGFKWAILNSAVQALLSLVIVIVLARLLTPQHYGQLAVAMVFITLADTLGRRGLGPAIVQRFELTERHIATGFTLSFATGAVLAGSIWVLAPWIARLLGDPDTAPILRTLALVTLITGVGVVSEHRLRRHLRFRALMAVSVVSKVIGGGFVAIGLALLDYGVWALVWGALARQAVFTLGATAFAPPPRGFAARRREAVELLSTGAGFSALALIRVLSGQTVSLVIAGTLGAASLGLFNRATALSVVTARLSPLLRDVLVPSMARRQRRIGRLRTVHLNGVELLSLVALPTSLMIAVSAPEIVAVVLGERWEAAVPALRILALAGGVQAIGAVHVPVVRAMGAVYRETWRRALLYLLLFGGAWFASRWGLLGIVVAVSAAGLVRHALLTHLTLGLLGVRFNTLLARYLPALWVGLGATAALWLSVEATRRAGWPATAALAVQLPAWAAAAAVAAYCAPPFARPAFHHFGLVQLPFEGMGRAGRWARGALEHLARRWPAAQEA